MKEWNELLLLLIDSNRIELTEELEVLNSIYSSSSSTSNQEATLPLTLYTPPSSRPSTSHSSPPPSKNKINSNSNSTILLQLKTTTTESNPPHPLLLIISIPFNYPEEEHPIIQLGDTYLGNHAISDEFFGKVLRIFMHESTATSSSSSFNPGLNGSVGGGGIGIGMGEGIEFQKGSVILYEAIELVRSLTGKYIESLDSQNFKNSKLRERDREREELLRKGDLGYKIPYSVSVLGRGKEEEEIEDDDDEKMIRAKFESLGFNSSMTSSSILSIPRSLPPPPHSSSHLEQESSSPCPLIVSTEPLIDRRSVFIGHSAYITSTYQLNQVLSSLLADKRIAKASHNMYAYRISQINEHNGMKIVLADNEDDGETAAGSRLGYLLGLVDVNNVVVIVSRWFGGIHLGSDRFKHINSVARDALELGGFLDDKHLKTTSTTSSSSSLGGKNLKTAGIGTGGGKKKK